MGIEKKEVKAVNMKKGNLMNIKSFKGLALIILIVILQKIFFIVTNTTDWKSKKLLDANGNTVAMGKNIVDLGNGFYQVWENNDERFIVTSSKKVVIQCKNAKILDWISSKCSGGLAAIRFTEDTITAVDAFGTVLSNIKSPFKDYKADFISGLLRITDSNTLRQYYYNPINGKRVLEINP